MPRTSIAIQIEPATVDGVTDVTMVNCDETNFNQFENTGREVLIAKCVVSRTVRITHDLNGTPRLKDHALTAGSTYKFPCFPRKPFNHRASLADRDKIYIDVIGAAATDVLFAVIREARPPAIWNGA